MVFKSTIITSLLTLCFITSLFGMDTHLSLFADMEPDLPKPVMKMSPRERFRSLTENTSGGPHLTKNQIAAATLLIDNYSEFSEDDFKSFLSLETVINLLKGTDLYEPYRLHLLAIAHFNGWGQAQDQFLACEFANKSKELHPVGLGDYLLWIFHQRAGHILRIKIEENRNDLRMLLHLIKSASSKFEPAILAFQVACEFSQQLTLIQNQTQLPLIFLCSQITLPKTCVPTTCVPTELGIVELTRLHAEHTYVSTTLATLMQNSGEKPSNVTLKVGNLVLTGYYCPTRLSCVAEYIFSLYHKRQQKMPGQNIFFVNLTTLRHDPRLDQFFIPLAPLNDSEFLHDLPQKLLNLKVFFKTWYRSPTQRDVETLFTDIFKNLFIRERIHLVARLERLQSLLMQKDIDVRIKFISRLADAECFSHALASAELYLLKDTILNPQQNFIMYLMRGLVDARTHAALSIAHRSDHTKSLFEESYYWKLLKHFFSLATPDFSITWKMGDSLDVMNPLFAAHTYLEGSSSDDSNFAGWFDPNTHINAAFEIVKNSPDWVVEFLGQNPDKRINKEIELIVKEHIDNYPSRDQLWAFVATSNRKSLRKEMVSSLLMHPLINVLTETPGL